ncbi:hypothetical protein NIES22_27710 [Calothrix brevissima NIES-22]|nr:hypothetical protein NIES22_27710 [Calothrix brevissima NIES-22]
MKGQPIERTQRAVHTQQEHLLQAIAQQLSAIIWQKTTDRLVKPILAVPSFFAAVALLPFPAFYLMKYLQ